MSFSNIIQVLADEVGASINSAEIEDGAIVDADINAAAAIDATKIANGAVSSTEFQYLDGVTSAIQTQIDTNLKRILLTAVAANTTTSIPAGYQITGIFIKNTTANAVTGGVRIGTTDGGADVVVALATGANAIIGIPDATILLKAFSTSGATTLYIQAVAAWNSASLSITFLLSKII